MKKSRFTEEQITFALRQVDSGTPVAFGNEARSKIRRAETRGELRMEFITDPHRINTFKRGFGGRQERTYDCTVPVTARGRIYLAVRDAWRRHRPSSSCSRSPTAEVIQRDHR